MWGKKKEMSFGNNNFASFETIPTIGRSTTNKTPAYRQDTFNSYVHVTGETDFNKAYLLDYEYMNYPIPQNFNFKGSNVKQLREAIHNDLFPIRGEFVWGTRGEYLKNTSYKQYHGYTQLQLNAILAEVDHVLFKNYVLETCTQQVKNELSKVSRTSRLETADVIIARLIGYNYIDSEDVGEDDTPKFKKYYEKYLDSNANRKIYNKGEMKSTRFIWLGVCNHCRPNQILSSSKPTTKVQVSYKGDVEAFVPIFDQRNGIFIREYWYKSYPEAPVQLYIGPDGLEEKFFQDEVKKSGCKDESGKNVTPTNVTMIKGSLLGKIVASKKYPKLSKSECHKMQRFPYGSKIYRETSAQEANTKRHSKLNEMRTVNIDWTAV